MESTQPRKIEVGDHVTIGNGKVHWVVIGPLRVEFEGSIEVDEFLLESGMTGRRRSEGIGNVKLFRKGN